MNAKLILAMGMVLGFCTVQAQKINIPKAFANAATQTNVLLGEIANDTAAKTKNQVSPRTVEKGKLVMVRSGDWTSGFFAGELWYLYEFTKTLNGWS